MTVSRLARLADRFDPPPIEDRDTPEWVRPSAFAEARSHGEWHRYPHLDLIEREVLHAIETDGRLLISVSFRHGKSEYIARWLVAWFIARYQKRVILGTASKDLAESHGEFARDVIVEHGPDVFGVEVSNSSAAKAKWNLQSPAKGGLYAVGVGSSPIGWGADLIVVDDPFGSYEDAMSPTIRTKVKKWVTGSLMSRLNQGKGAVIVICARWHEDDLSGWLKTNAPDEWREIRLPALADDEDDPLGRELGEPLCPELYTAEALHRMRASMSLEFGEGVWLAQAQQDPTPPGGGMFPDDRWVVVDHLDFDPKDITWCRGWDLAATVGGGDFTVGVLMGWLPDPDGRFIVADVRRGQWAPEEWRQQLLTCAATDPPGTLIELPQDPGQAGKDQAGLLVSMLAGHNVNVRPQTKSKEIRANTYSAQQRGGRILVHLPAAAEGVFIAEHRSFPNGRNDDQVDAAATAFNGLVDPPGGSEVVEYYDPVEISPF